MTTQNVTVSVPKDVLKRVKMLAAQRGTSISRLLVEALEGAGAQDERYERARKRSLRVLTHPPDLGTQGRRRWSRDELHVR